MNINQTNQLYSKLNYLIRDGFLDNKYVILFGANRPSVLTYYYLSERNINVSAIIDNYPERRDKDLEDFIVEWAGDFFCTYNANKEDVVILIASAYFKEMKRSVYKYGFNDSQFIQTLFSASYSVSEELFKSHTNTIMEGFTVYNRIKKAFGDDVFIIMNPRPCIGDAVYSLSLLYEYIGQNNLTNYVYVISGRSAGKVAKMFGYVNCIDLPASEMEAISALSDFMKPNDIKDTFFSFPNRQLFTRISSKTSLNWDDVLRGIILKLAPNIKKALLPRLSENIDGFLNENNIIRGKTAVIATEAVSCEGLPNTFWRLLVKSLKDKGYFVRLNWAENESLDIDGGEPLFIPLENVVRTVEEAGLFIGLRSGLCDLVSFADCKKVFIYHNQEYLNFFGIENICLPDGGSDTIELVYKGDDKTVGLIMERI